ncbi:MAG: hypothetical protein KBC64_01730, partial [Simkaniaceae bacterium]|nr:hypothetical protein [Simkaniaceae bacterium]
MTTPQIKARDLNPYLIRWDNLPGIEAMVTDRSSTDPKTQTVNTRIALLKIWCPPLLNPDYLALQKHVTGQMPLSTDKFIEHLDHLNLLSLSAGKIADLVKARFWELGGRQTPEGRDWVRDSIPELAHRETLRKSLYSVCTHLCPADYLLELLEDKAEVSSEEIIRSLKLLGEPFAARVFSYMYHNHSPKEPP